MVLAARLHQLREHRVVRGLHFYSFGALKRLYNWVLSWAESQYSSYALCVLAFIESSFFPIPPDVLQISLSVAKPKRSYWYAFLATVFSVIGGLFGYFIGMFLFESIGGWIINTLGYEHYFLQVGELYKQNAFIAILGAALTPIPYKVFTIGAGLWRVGLTPLLLGSLIGRAGRFFFVATLTYFWGERVKVFVEKYFNWVSLGIFLLIVAGYVLVKWFV